MNDLVQTLKKNCLKRFRQEAFDKRKRFSKKNISPKPGLSAELEASARAKA